MTPIRRRTRTQAGRLARQLGEHRRAVRRHPGELAREPRRVGGEREHHWQPRRDRLQAPPAFVGTRHPDVDVQPLHPLPPHRDAAVTDELHVPLLLDDRLRLGQRERVSRGGRDRETFGLGRLGGRAAERRQRSLVLGDVRADVRVRLEHRCEELGLHLARELAALDSAQHAVDGGDLPYVPASRIISSSSTPSENGGAPPNRCSISRGADAVHRPAGGDPGVVRGARPEFGAVAGDARVAADVAGAGRVAQEVRVVDVSQTRIRCAAVMNSAMKPQPAAGHGNGSVRTQNHPSWSPFSSSSQSSSSSKTIVEVCSNTICPRSIAHKVAADADRRPAAARAGRRSRGRLRDRLYGESRRGLTVAPDRGSR